MKTFVIIGASVCMLGQAPGVKQGAALPVAVPQSVKQVVSVQAVMLPYTVNRELFSKHIADNYAVVVVNLGNRSHDAALMMQGIYLDYSKWALSGNVGRVGSELKDYSSGTQPGQVSSVEYRIVRGELEDRDPKTIRNWIMRSLIFAGQVAGGSTFVFGVASNIPKYVSMASGVGIPGFEKLWPDSLVAKLNRISDFGYRVNRVVPRESSDVMIAFFPIDRFLTPKLKRIFVKQPALFFNTGLALMEPNREMTAILERVSGRKLKDLTSQVPAMIACASEHVASACEQSQGLRDMVAATSLNSIEVVIDGNMMIDLSTMAPVVEKVEFQEQLGSYWKTAGADKAVSVSGRFLDGGTVTVDPAEAGISWVAADPIHSTSEKLAGTLRFSKPVPSGQQLLLKVVKGTMTSAAMPHTVNYARSDVALNVTGRVVLVTGTNLANAVLSLTRTKPAIASAALFPLSGSSTVVDLRTQPGGCYDATVFTADGMPLTQQLILAPQPVITRAVRVGNSVTLEGNDLFAMSDNCTTSSLGVALVDEKGGSFTPGNVTSSGAAIVFDFAFPDTTSKWQVRVTGSKAVLIQ